MLFVKFEYLVRVKRMSKILSRRIFLGKSPKKYLRKKTSLIALIVASTALSGCVSLDRNSLLSNGVSQFTTASTNSVAKENLTQALPNALPNNVIQVASSNVNAKYIPPASIGNIITTQNATYIGTQVNNANPVKSNNLPPLIKSPALGSKKTMSAQPLSQPVITTPAPILTSTPKASGLPQNAYMHIVQSGESLYSIARKYNVNVSAITSANGMASADRIGVGQKIGIPGKKAEKSVKIKTATITPIVAVKSAPILATTPALAPVPVKTTNIAPVAKVIPKIKPIVQTVAPKSPVQTAKVTVQQPAVNNEKFRWPVSGKLITDFVASKGTGINIAVAKGTKVKSSASGTIIYVGNAVEGYGNLILIKHTNGFVSAYAHLENANVVKGDIVKKGDTIGVAGQSGSVSSTQLHFELRKGATPVDPIPMLAS